MRRLPKIRSTQVWKLALEGNVMATSATNAQPADRYKGPNRARWYEEAKLERSRRHNEKRVAAVQAAQMVACVMLLMLRLQCCMQYNASVVQAILYTWKISLCTLAATVCWHVSGMLLL